MKLYWLFGNLNRSFKFCYLFSLPHAPTPPPPAPDYTETEFSFTWTLSEQEQTPKLSIASPLVFHFPRLSFLKHCLEIKMMPKWAVRMCTHACSRCLCGNIEISSWCWIQVGRPRYGWYSTSWLCIAAVFLIRHLVGVRITGQHQLTKQSWTIVSVFSHYGRTGLGVSFVQFVPLILSADALKPG